MMSNHTHINLKPSKPIMSMIKVYLANLLSGDYGIETFTRDSVDCLAIYLYQVIASILISVKSILSAQGRVMPSVLHVLLALKIKNITLDSFLCYLIDKEKANERRVGTCIINKYDTKCLVIKQNQLFEDDVADELHSNILNIPINYVSAQQLKRNPLPLRKPICEYIDKPSPFSYLTEEVTTEKHFEGEAIKRQAVLAEFEIRAALTKKQKMITTVDHDEMSKIKVTHFTQNREQQRMSFDLCKYL